MASNVLSLEGAPDGQKPARFFSGSLSQGDDGYLQAVFFISDVGKANVQASLDDAYNAFSANSGISSKTFDGACRVEVGDNAVTLNLAVHNQNSWGLEPNQRFAFSLPTTGEPSY